MARYLDNGHKRQWGNEHGPYMMIVNVESLMEGNIISIIIISSSIIIIIIISIIITM